MRAPCSMKRALQPEISVIQFGRRTETVARQTKEQRVLLLLERQLCVQCEMERMCKRLNIPYRTGLITDY